MRSATHICKVDDECKVSVALFYRSNKSVPPSRDYTEEDMKGPRKVPRREVPTQVQLCRSPGRQRANIEGSASDGSTAHEAPVETASSWAPVALTVLGGQAVVMLQER